MRIQRKSRWYLRLLFSCCRCREPRQEFFPLCHWQLFAVTLDCYCSQTNSCCTSCNLSDIPTSLETSLFSLVSPPTHHRRLGDAWVHLPHWWGLLGQVQFHLLTVYIWFSWGNLPWIFSMWMRSTLTTMSGRGLQNYFRFWLDILSHICCSLWS